MTDGEAAARFQAIYERALARYRRRKAATDWFWYWSRKRWDWQPKASTKVRGRLVADVPELAHSPRRISHVFYEDCLALEDEAEAFLNRLWRRQKGGGQGDITQLECT